MIEIVEVSSEVLVFVKGLLADFAAYRAGQLGLEQIRQSYGYSIAEGFRRSQGKDGLYFPYRKGYRALVKVRGDVVEFWFKGRLLGKGRLSRALDGQGCWYGLRLERGRLYLALYVAEKGVPSEPARMLKHYRRRAFEEVPEEFCQELLSLLKPRFLFWDGGPTPNLELRAVEEYAKEAISGRFLYFWERFKRVRDELTFKNTALINKVLKDMRISGDDWDEFYAEGLLVLLRAVGMWDADRGMLSTIAYNQLKARFMKLLEGKRNMLSLDVPVVEGEPETFADFLHDSRSWEGDLFFSYAG